MNLSSAKRRVQSHWVNKVQVRVDWARRNSRQRFSNVTRTSNHVMIKNTARNAVGSLGTSPPPPAPTGQNVNLMA